jgi:hypothetical protein
MPRKKVISFCPLLLLLLLFARNGSANVCPHTAASFNKKTSISVLKHGVPGSIDRLDLPGPPTVLGTIGNQHIGHRNDLQGYLHSAYSLSGDCTSAQLTLFTLQLLQFYTPTQRLILFPKHWFW